MAADMPDRHPLQKYEGNRQERNRQANRAYRKANPERAREVGRRWKQQRCEEISGRPKPSVCDVCGEPGNYGGKPRICFDHCHAQGGFRGWLCDRCNMVLGKAKDDADLLRRLADYLEKGIACPSM